MIALAYYSIPTSLIYLVRKRRDLAFNWIFVMFAFFILACGTTHIIDIGTVWLPYYGMEGLVKLFTGVISLITAIALWYLMPKALAIPSQEQLQKLNEDLEGRVLARTQDLESLNLQLQKEILEHQRAESEIQRLNRDLRHKVDEMQKLFDLAPVGIAVADDPACRVIRSNKICAEMLGISPDTNASKSAEDGESLPFKVLAAGKELSSGELPMQMAAASKRSISGIELDVIRDDGTTIHLYEHAIPLFDDENEVRGCLGIFVGFIAETDVKRRLKVCFQRTEANGKVYYEIKTAYAPNEIEEKIYEKYGKR